MEPPPRPTQRPLDREEQKAFFEARKQLYKVPEQSVPAFPIEPLKLVKPPETEQNKNFLELLKDRGIESAVKKVEEVIEEKKTTTTIKQFYCNHIFNPVRASYMGIPIRYKICAKCGLVK
jgi:hypothetical protein